MNWRTLAIATPLVMVAYLVVTEWVPMRPWNDLEASQPRERLIAAAVNYSVALVIATAFVIDDDWSVIVGIVLSVVWMGGHLLSWWIPYLFGIASHAQRDSYHREYSRTLKLLPTEGHVVVPDAQHMVVGLLSVVMLAAAAGAAAHHW